MPKLKTHRGTAKRIKITGNGKILRSQAGQVHFNEKKGEGRKRSIAGKTTVKGAIGRNLKRAIGAK